MVPMEIARRFDLIHLVQVLLFMQLISRLELSGRGEIIVSFEMEVPYSGITCFF